MRLLEIENTVCLFHSTDTSLEEGNTIPFKIREKPTDTHVLIHNYVNQISEEIFGIPIRNLLFTMPNKEKTIIYGHYCYEVEPVSHNDKVYFNKNINDFTSDIGSIGIFSNIRFIKYYGFNLSNDINSNYLENSTTVIDYIDKLISIINDEDYSKSIYNGDKNFEKCRDTVINLLNTTKNEVIKTVKEYIDGIEEMDYKNFIRKNSYKDSEFEVMLYAKSGIKIVKQVL